MILIDIEDFDVSSLAANTGILVDTYTVVEDFRMLKLELHVFKDSVAADTGLYVFLASADLSLAEISSVLQARGPLGPGDVTVAELASRPVWILSSPHGPSMIGDSNNTLYLEWKKRWTFHSGRGFVIGIFNTKTALAASSSITLKGKAFGLWLL